MNTPETRKISDLKDRKVGRSCAECRRSKLKCDRVFPCQSCIRRGCAQLCPDGMLTATKGNRVLVLQAQKLTEQVNSMSARIQELERALQQSSAGAVHPLLSQTNENHPWESTSQDVSDAIGSLSIGTEGNARYHGQSAGSEYFYTLISDESELSQSQDQDLSDLPFEVIDLANSFPFGLKDCPYTKNIFEPFLPTREGTLHVVDLYYKNVAWMYDPIVIDDFMKTIVDSIYDTTGLPSLRTLHPHRLSVFFMLLATGILYDDNCLSAPAVAEQYYALSRAAFALDSILVDATCAAVQALFMMFRYIYSSDRSGNESRWLLSGLCCRLAQTIGLERDSAGWKLEHEEVQRRRKIFWELYTLDAWTSLVNGRPPALNIQYTDCRFPEDSDSTITASGDSEWGWHAWKFRYSASCLSISVLHAFSTKVPQYSTLLELDKKIRQFPLPQHLQAPVQSSETKRVWSTDPCRAMQQYCAICERECNLLYLHRSYFAQAIREQSRNPLQHTYAPSVLAVYRSACRLLSALRSLYAVHRKLTSRVWFFWSGIFSSCIVFGALVVESPGCVLARNALQEFEHALLFYEEGSRPCGPPAYPAMLQKLYQRAYYAYNTFHAGTTGTNTSAHKVYDDPNAPDELEVLEGRKSVISNKSGSNASSTHNASSQGSHQSVRASSEDSGVGRQQDQEDASMMNYDDLDYVQAIRNDPGLFDTGSYPVVIEKSTADIFSGQHPFESSASAHGYGFVEAPRYINPGNQDYSNADPQILSGSIQHNFDPVPLTYQSGNSGQEESAYDAPSMHQKTNKAFPDAQGLGTYHQNQEEIWRDFIHQLGL